MKMNSVPTVYIFIVLHNPIFFVLLQELSQLLISNSKGCGCTSMSVSEGMGKGMGTRRYPPTHTPAQ